MHIMLSNPCFSNGCYFCCFHFGTSDSSQEITDGDQEESMFWDLFIQLTTKLKSLNLLHFFTDHAVTEVAHRKVINACNTFSTLDIILFSCTDSLGESFYTGEVFSRI